MGLMLATFSAFLIGIIWIVISAVIFVTRMDTRDDFINGFVTAYITIGLLIIAVLLIMSLPQ